MGDLEQETTITWCVYSYVIACLIYMCTYVYIRCLILDIYRYIGHVSMCICMYM